MTKESKFFTEFTMNKFLLYAGMYPTFCSRFATARFQSKTLTLFVISLLPFV